MNALFRALSLVVAPLLLPFACSGDSSSTSETASETGSSEGPSSTSASAGESTSEGATTTAGSTSEATSDSATEGTTSEGATEGTTAGTTETTTGGDGELIVGGDRPAKVYVPPGLDPEEPTPLVVLLHGYGASGEIQEFVFKLQPEAEARRFLYVYPDGTYDAEGKRFWNATNACCDFFGSQVDDVAYLSGLVAEIGEHYALDPQRVFFLGHSNGGFMTHRMACERSELIAAGASLAGAVWSDPQECPAKAPVSVLQIHGTADTTVLYEGGEFFPGYDYPGALTTTQTWAAKNGCALTGTPGEALDLEWQIGGAETSVERFDTGCAPGGAAELWTIAGGAHVPALSEEFPVAVIDWLFDHPKP